jgi:hypothetical protein
MILSTGCKVNNDIDGTRGYLAAPTLISPENDSVISETQPTFTWEIVHNILSYDFRVLNGGNSSTSGILYHVTVAFAYGTTTASHNLNFELGPGTYTWKVRWVRDVDT